MAKKIIYADNAATTQMSQAAMDSMIRYLSTDYSNASQPYSFSRYSKKALRGARETIADCIGAKPDEIYFTSGGSESDNWVIKNAWLNGQNILTTEIEHHAILNACQFVARQNGKVSYLPVFANGIICPDEIKKRLSQDSLISIMMANNEIGTIEPIRQYGLMAREMSATIHTDAVQAMGHIDINVKELDIDLLSASGHKFNGPKGIGFLYVRQGTKIQSLINGGTQEFGLRAGTENVAAIVAMAVALRENIEEMEDNQRHLHDLEDNLVDKLRKSSVSVVRNGTNQLPGLMSLSFENLDGETLLHRLDLLGICVSTGSACDSKNTQVSHVLKAINLPLEYAKGTIRVSFGKYNTMEDSNAIAEALIKLAR